MNEISGILTKVEQRYERASEQAQKALDREYHRWVDNTEKEWDDFFKQAWKPITFRDVLLFKYPSMWHTILVERCDCLEEAFRKYCSSRINDLEKNAEGVLRLQLEALSHDLRPLSIQLWHHDPKAYRKICEFLIGEYALKRKHYNLDDYYVFAEIFPDAVIMEHTRHILEVPICYIAIPNSEKLSENIWKFLPNFPLMIALLMRRPAEFNKYMSSMIKECLFSRIRNADQSYWNSICEKYFVQRVRCVTESIRGEFVVCKK